jgi:hypothetical protein
MSGLHELVLLPIPDTNDRAGTAIYLLFDKSDTLNVNRMVAQMHSCCMMLFNGAPYEFGPPLWWGALALRANPDRDASYFGMPDG